MKRVHCIPLQAFQSINETHRRIFLRVLTCFTGLLLFLAGYSQRKPLKFEHISTGMGLSQSNVISIFQDSRGFMWFGTRDGLNKYDGYKFTVFKYDATNPHSISHNTIHDIAEDTDGNIWVATWGGGINKYDWKKERFIRYQFNTQDPTSLRKNHINRIFRDSEGSLWIGTEGGGLNLYNKSTNSFISFVHDEVEPASISDNKVRDIAEDSHHNLWIATTGGLELFDKKSKTFRHFRHDADNEATIASDNIARLFVCRNDQLWIGTRGRGVDLFDIKKEIFTHFRGISDSSGLRSNVIKTLYDDEAGNIWVGTENGGISVYNPATASFDNYQKDDADVSSLNNNSIWAIHRDAKGNMWIGTSSTGINFVNRDASKFIHYRHTSAMSSLSNNSVLSLFEDSDGDIWVGTDGGGLNLFDPVNGTFKHYLQNPADSNSMGGNYVLDIHEDSDKNLWVGTWADGVTVFNKRKNSFRHIKYDHHKPGGLSSPNIWTIFEDSYKNIWLGTYSSGISRYDKSRDSFVHYRSDAGDPGSLGNNTVNVIYEDSRRNLWIGTNGSGLDLFNKKTEKFSHFTVDTDKNSISNDDIYCMAEDRQGNLWVGTNLGLNRLDRNGVFTSFYTKDGLPSNTIAGLLIDKSGVLWVSTFNGISRFNPISKTFTNYGINDGLQSQEFKMNSCMLSRNGKMYFGGINGFNEFVPDAMRDKKFDPPLVFTNLRVFNRDVPVGEDDKAILQQSITTTSNITLPYDQSVVTFEFASLNYTDEDKKQYSYKLDGFDADWNYVGTRHSATYTNLNPGEYTFKVRKLNNEGKWSLSTANMKLTVTPPYWMTWWFRISVLAAIVGGVLLIYRIRVNNIQSQRRKLQKLVQEKTRQLMQSTEEEQKAREEAEKARLEIEETNKKLERKNKELEQFAYVASHDMQEPLRTTTSYVELLHRQYQGKLDEKADKYLNYISQSADRMKLLIKDLLDFSRIGNKGKQEKVDCNGILQNVLADLAVAIQESGAEIKAGTMPVINGYPTEIKQLFQNLVVNAIKFRRKDAKPRIKICSKKSFDKWEFTVEDNGIGIDPKHSDKIFVIFQRLHTRDAYEGSGIGLAHCKKIVELHGGKIWVESIPGHGSAFYFTIPIATNSQLH